VFTAELQKLADASRPNCTTLSATRSHNDPFVATSQALVPDIARSRRVLCGPPGFADARRPPRVASCVPRRHIHVEQFAF